MTTVAFYPTVTVRCECGEIFDISSRSDRRHRKQQTRWRCLRCRRQTRQIEVQPRYINYWLDRYSMEWIQETAFMIWGDR